MAPKTRSPKASWYEYDRARRRRWGARAGGQRFGLSSPGAGAGDGCWGWGWGAGQRLCAACCAPRHATGIAPVSSAHVLLLRMAVAVQSPSGRSRSRCRRKQRDRQSEPYRPSPSRAATSFFSVRVRSVRDQPATRARLDDDDDAPLAPSGNWLKYSHMHVPTVPLVHS